MKAGFLNTYEVKIYKIPQILLLGMIVALLPSCEKTGNKEAGNKEAGNAGIDICSAVSLKKILLGGNTKNFAVACSDGIALLRHDASVRLLPYPRPNSSCIPEDDQEQVEGACLPRSLEASRDNKFFAASYGKKHLLYFSSEASSTLELDRELSDFAFSPRGKYLIVLDQSGYLHWFETEDSFSKAHEFPIRNKTWFRPGTGEITEIGFDDDISNARWPALSVSEKYIFVLRTEPGTGGNIYRIPLNDEQDPATFLSLPQIGSDYSASDVPDIGRIDLPRGTTVPGGSEDLIPADLHYSGFMVRLTGTLAGKEAGRLYITHKNSGTVRICDASEGDPGGGTSWLDFSGGNINISATIDPVTLEPVTQSSFGAKTVGGGVCGSLETSLGLEADPSLRHSALNRFVYLMDSDGVLKIINNDYYSQYHIDHSHDRLKEYTVLPLSLSANSLASFYYYQEPYQALPYYPRGNVEAAFTASMAVLDGNELYYFKETSVCFAASLGECPEADTALEQDAIHAKTIDLPADGLIKVVLLGDHVFYVYKDANSLKFKRDKLSWP